MTKMRSFIRLAAAFAMLGATAPTAEASALCCRGQHAARVAPRAKPPCLIRQTRPDGTVVFIDRCTQQSSVRPPVAQRLAPRLKL
jgi:hypothetical protein